MQSTTPGALWRPSHRALLCATLALAAVALLVGWIGSAPGQSPATADVTDQQFMELVSDALALPTPLPHRASHARRGGRRVARRTAAATRPAVSAPVTAGILAVPTAGTVPQCGWFHCPRPGHLHNGLDVSSVQGTPVLAAADGVVIGVEMPQDSEGYGLFICLQHTPQLATCYAHMAAWVVGIEPGAHVKRGQPIGLVGSTGHSTGPHLHFEVRRGPAGCAACAVDPYPYFFPAGRAPA